MCVRVRCCSHGGDSVYISKTATYERTRTHASGERTKHIVAGINTQYLSYIAQVVQTDARKCAQAHTWRENARARTRAEGEMTERFTIRQFLHTIALCRALTRVYCVWVIGVTQDRRDAQVHARIFRARNLAHLHCVSFTTSNDIRHSASPNTLSYMQTFFLFQIE